MPSTTPYITHISTALALTIATLYTLAGQAHFTSSLTPSLAANIEEMTRNSFAAFSFLGLDYPTVSSLFMTSHGIRC
jgi:hypothetical protein